jgi:hypothetical protein
MLGNDTYSNDRACPAHQFCSTHQAKLTEFLQNTTIVDDEMPQIGRTLFSEPRSGCETVLLKVPRKAEALRAELLAGN